MAKNDEWKKELANKNIELYQEKEKNKHKFIQIPKQFYECPFYKEFLTPSAREIYGLLRDRLDLSITTIEKRDSKEGTYVDEDGLIYEIFSRESIMKILGLSKQTTSDAFKTLSKLNLIYEKKFGQGKPNHIYVAKVRYLTEEEALKLIEETKKNEDSSKTKKSKLSSKNGSTKPNSQKSKNSTSRSKEDNKKEDFQKSKNSTSRSPKNRLLEVEKLDGINTNINNTEFTKTESCSSSKERTVEKEKSKEDLFSELLKIYAEYFGKNGTLAKSRIKKLYTHFENCNYNFEFVKSIIEYTIDQGAETHKYFDNTFNKLLEKGINTVEAFEKSVQEHYEKNKNKFKNSSKTNKNSKSNSKAQSFTKIPSREYNYEILERRLLGESVEDIAKDYGITVEEVINMSQPTF